MEGREASEPQAGSRGLRAALVGTLSSTARSPSSSMTNRPPLHNFTFFSYPQVPQGAPDKILGIAQAFKNDPSDKKVNLVIGAYRDGAGSPWVLPSVRTAEKRLIERNANKE